MNPEKLEISINNRKELLTIINLLYKNGYSDACWSRDEWEPKFNGEFRHTDLTGERIITGARYITLVNLFGMISEGPRKKLSYEEAVQYLSKTALKKISNISIKITKTTIKLNFKI